MLSTPTLSPTYLRLLDFAKAFNSVNTPTSASMDQTVRDLREVQGSAWIIGGLAVAHYGLERTTEDVDILYENRDTQILKRLSKYFEVVRNASNGWSELRHKVTAVRLELIPEGGLTQFGFIPFCNIVGGADGYISLSGLIWLKLVSGRPQDDADVVRLLKLHPDVILRLRHELTEVLQTRLDELGNKAVQDSDNDPFLHPEKFMKRMLPDGTIVDLSKPNKEEK